jgi:membrane-bound serine protease (ClpP class)
VAQTPLSPQGKVFIHGEVWDAVSSANIPAGQTVVVRQVDGLKIHVDPVSSTQQRPSTAIVV